MLARNMVLTMVTLQRVQTVAARRRASEHAPLLQISAAGIALSALWYVVYVRKMRSPKPPPMPASLRAKLALGQGGGSGGYTALPGSSRVLPVAGQTPVALGGGSGQEYVSDMLAPRGVDEDAIPGRGRRWKRAVGSGSSSWARSTAATDGESADMAESRGAREGFDGDSKQLHSESQMAQADPLAAPLAGSSSGTGGWKSRVRGSGQAGGTAADGAVDPSACK